MYTDIADKPSNSPPNWNNVCCKTLKCIIELIWPPIKLTLWYLGLRNGPTDKKQKLAIALQLVSFTPLTHRAHRRAAVPTAPSTPTGSTKNQTEVPKKWHPCYHTSVYGILFSAISHVSCSLRQNPTQDPLKCYVCTVLLHQRYMWSTSSYLEHLDMPPYRAGPSSK